VGETSTAGRRKDSDDGVGDLRTPVGLHGTTSSQPHRPLEPGGVLVSALLVAGVVTAISVVTIGHLGVLVIAFTMGLGNGVATRSIAVMQTTAPPLARGGVIARSELSFQLATLLGAGLAVLLTPSPRPGRPVTAVVLVGTGAIYARLAPGSLRQQESRWIVGEQAPAISRTLPRALLIEAEHSHRSARPGWR
jgi:hypothetical protein